MRQLFIAFSLAFFTSQLAQASLEASFRNVNFDDHAVDTQTFVLGRSCYSMRLGPMSTQCNPAFLADNEGRQFKIFLNMDNRALDLWDWSQDLRNRDEAGLIRRILENSDPFVTQQSIRMVAQMEWMRLTYTPYRLATASLVSNPAYPTVSTHSSLQSELSTSAGFYAAEDENFRMGLNLRWVRNRELRNQFSVFDALADEQEYQIRKTDTLYAEPAFSYQWVKSWKAEASVVLTHLAVYQSDADQKDKPRPEIGLTSQPDFLGGKLTTTLHYSNRPDVTELSHRIRFGGIFAFTPTFSGQASLAGEEVAIGIMGQIQSAVLGLALKSEPFYFEGQRLSTITSTFATLGFSF